MFYKVKIALLVALASLLSSQVMAIGLGDITLKTELNEPLNAEIGLLQVTDLSEHEILINLAPKSDFEAAGVERAFFLTSLRFKLDLDNENGPVIHVTTDLPVREPYLNFLVEVQWPAGRLLREYTLLMDLPSFSDTTSSSMGIQGSEVTQVHVTPEPLDIQELEAELEALEATTVTTSTRAPVSSSGGTPPAPPSREESGSMSTYSEPEPAPEPASTTMDAEDSEPVEDYETSTPIYSSNLSDGEYGPVQGGENLWRIAMQRRPADASIQQTMLAIQRLNPEAFIEGNINLLKKGQILRMPTDGQINDMTYLDALEEVRRQNIDWSGDPDGRKTPDSGQIDATYQAAETYEEPTDYEDGQLKLSVPGDSSSSGAGKGSGEIEGEIEALNNDLVIAMEELDRMKREEGDVSGAISELDEQIETIEQMLEIHSSELEALEAALSADALSDDLVDTAPADDMMDDVVEDTADDMADDAEDMVEDAADDMMVEPADDSGDLVSDDLVSQPPVFDDVETSPVETTTITEESAPADASDGGIVGMLMDNLMLIIGAIVGVIVLVAAGLFLKNRQSDGGSDDFDAESEFEDLLESDDESDSAADVSLDELDEIAESLDGGADEHADTVLEQALDLEEEEEAAPEPEEQAETGDVLGEADIYISFGNFEKAEGLLKSAIDSDPSRVDVLVKLCELYSETGDLANFDDCMEKLSSLGDEGALERAKELRGKIPGGADTEMPTGKQEEVSDDDGLDLDLDLDVSDDEPEAAVEESVDEGDSDLGDLDFDLDLSDEAEESAEDDDLSLDLSEDSSDDLDLDLDSVLDDLAETEEEAPVEAEESDLDFDLDLDLSGAEEDVAVSEEPTTESPAVTVSEAPTVQTAAVDMSESPTVSNPVVDISESPTVSTPAVQVSEAKTESHDELDLDELAGDLAGDVEPPAEETTETAEDAPTPTDTALDEEFDFLADSDEAATKLELARAYIDMGDKDGARDILEEVLEEGQDAQKQEAKQLLDNL